MQPTVTLEPDVKTLADWVFEQFKPTDPVMVQNILSTPYHFKYCVSEDVETPDPFVRRVISRNYEEKTFAPGEKAVLLGGQAYIFVGAVAHSFIYEHYGADKTADLPSLVAAAQKVIIGKVGYNNNESNADVAQSESIQPMTTVLQDQPTTAPTLPTTPEQPFADLNATTEAGFELEGNKYSMAATKDGKTQYRKNGKLISAEEYNDAADNAAA